MTLKKNILQVLQSTDPLDSPDFNTIDYINQLFPTEQSLSNIDDVITKMETEVTSIDDHIRSVVRSQSNTGQDGLAALHEAQKVVVQLFSQIVEIKTRAERTEDMVNCCIFVIGNRIFFLFKNTFIASG